MAMAALGPRFAKLWSAGIAANVADGVMLAAFPLLIATLTRDPFLVAMGTFVYRLPWFVFEIFAGELVDRADRRKLMLFGNMARSLAVGVLTVLIVGDMITLPAVYVIAFALGIAETFVDTSWEAFVPMIVEPDLLEVANGRTQGTEWTANELAGPPLGGFLFAVAAGLAFGVVSVAYAFAALLLALIAGDYATHRQVAHGKGALRKEIGEGLRWLWNHKVLRALSLTAALANLLSTAMLSVFVLFAQEILGLNDVGFGLVLAMAGVGGIVGAFAAHRVEGALGPGRLLIVSMVMIAGTALAVATTSSPVVVGAAFAIEGFSVAMWNVVVVTLRQELTPDALRGRVAADARVLAFGALPIGALVGGVLADLVGLRAPFFLAAGVFAVALLGISKVVNNRTVAQLREEAALERAAEADSEPT